MRKQTYYISIGALGLLVGALAVTHQSLWIDEGVAALKAMEPTLAGWWHSLRAESDSNLQLLGQIFYLWGWVKIFGASEIALRASNIPFFAGGVLALAWGMAQRRSWQTATVALALTNAFLWYYLSEARPYIVLFAFSAVTAACLFRVLQNPEESLQSGLWYRLFCTGVIGLCATSLIAVPWALGAIGAVLYWGGLRAGTRCALRFKAASAVLLAALAGLGLYYLWTVQLGAPPSAVGRTSWVNIAFIFYELLGQAGLGPGRLALRAQGAGEAAAFLPMMMVGAISALALLLLGLMAVGRSGRRRHLLFFSIAVVVPSVLVFAAGASAHMRLVGRHLTPLLPFLLAWLGIGLAALLSAPSPWKKILGAGLLAVFLSSSLEIRFAARHQRDDYRSAAAVARQSLQKTERVWWLANVSTGLYYHLPLPSPHITASPDLPRPKESPDLVILSKPDTYDPSGAARAYLAENGFKVAQVLPAFEIWRRPSVR